MAIPPTTVTGAYGAASRLNMRDAAGTQGAGQAGNAFGAMVQDAAQSTISQLRGAEQQSARAIAGRGDLNQVVMAVANAEVTLQTAVAVRDRVIQAYMDIVRMPI